MCSTYLSNIIAAIIELITNFITVTSWGIPIAISTVTWNTTGFKSSSSTRTYYCDKERESDIAFISIGIYYTLCCCCSWAARIYER